MDKMEIAVDSLSGKDAEKAYRNMLLFCNTYSFNIKRFQELIKQKPKRIKTWSNICWYWVENLAKDYLAEKYDLRNRQSCNTACIIQQTVDEKYDPLPKLMRDDFISVYIGGIAYGHRTIQQSFTSLVFAWLEYLAVDKNNKKAKHAIKKIKETYGSHWYEMPMY